MARFTHGFRTTLTTDGSVAELIGGTGSERVRLVELGITLAAQTLSVVGVGYAAAQGITPSSPVTLLCEGDNPTTTVSDAVAWGTRPTQPAASYYFRRATLPLAQSFPLVWRWAPGSGILLLPSTSLALFLIGAGALIDGWWTVER